VTTTDDLVAHAATYATSFDGGGLSPDPARKVIVISCVDARLDLGALLGLGRGDAHVVRNLGGVVTDDELRAISISQRVMATEEVVVIRHTGCRMLGFDDEAFRHELRDETGQTPTWPAKPLPDLDEDLRRSLVRIRDCPFVPRTGSVRGFVYDVGDGTLREVS